MLTRANQLSAWDAAQLLARRELTAVGLLQACLDRIGERDSQVRAFACMDAQAALAQARVLDAGPVRGLLHGLPFGVKDIFDTADLPTEFGSPIYRGHRPPGDAAAVALCRSAGAVMVGKTVTTELANMFAGLTRNPLNLAHTPGGSSSGSAAAVADCMLPLALGTQTAGSLIRPAAFCGVVGYKASYGRISRAGVKGNSETLDTLGGFGRSVRDVALLAGVLLGDSRVHDAMSGEPGIPRIGFCATPEWLLADADVHNAWSHAERALDAQAVRVAWPAKLAEAMDVQKEVQAFETAMALADERRRHGDQLSAPLQALIATGLRISAQHHIRNLQRTALLRQACAALFDNADVLLVPSSIGEAPEGLQGTGDPVFCRTWTLLGLPSIHLPFSRGRKGLPVGLQLVGAYGKDHALFAAAQWVHERLKST
jgi:Asp-tRNA(Asn)/Glu-tRNA(Gln) amidotransferase A subunit family amidase